MVKMRRLFLSFLLPFVGIAMAVAQVGQHRSDFSVGFNGGMMFSNVGFMPEVPQDMHQGLTGGFSLRYTSEKYFNSICAIVAEVNYAQVGWKERILTPNDEPVINGETGLAEEYCRKVDYIQVPLFARLGWGRERRGFLSVQRKVDYGIAAGLGLEFSLKNVGHFLVEGRYYYGLGDIFRNSKRDYFGRSNLNNICVKLTYLFDITKTKNSNIK